MTDWEHQWSMGETPWDKGAPAPPLEEILSLGRCDVDGRRVLVPGCGSGHDVRLLAAQGAEVVGLDLSPTALRVARSHPPAGRERYVEGDLMGWEDEPFDFVWEHTCFCAIPPSQRESYAAAVHRLLKPGGVLFGVFFLRPWDEGEPANPPPHGVSREELESVFGVGFDLEWHQVPTRSYPGREGREWLAVFRKTGPDRGVAVSRQAG